MIFLFSFLFLVVGVVVGWMSAERYIAFMQHVEHDHEELFEENPHPELFDKNGKLYRGDYITLAFDAGFDPELWDPETDIKIDE